MNYAYFIALYVFSEGRVTVCFLSIILVNIVYCIGHAYLYVVAFVRRAIIDVLENVISIVSMRIYLIEFSVTAWSHTCVIYTCDIALDI